VLAKHGGFSIARGFGFVDRLMAHRYLREHGEKKLNVGCGLVPLDGWLNVDVFPVSRSILRMNATRRFPFGDGVFDYVFSEHMIEHITYPQGQGMLKECFRVLKPGGIIRISTPDLAFLCAVYQPEKPALLQSYLEFHWRLSTPWAPTSEDTFFINNFVRDWRHQFIYDEKVLRQALAQAGFREISRWALGESEHLPLRNLENEQRMPRGFVRLETFTLEGTKPG
jgi:predicted SAM-dependent methyltransferase